MKKVLIILILIVLTLIIILSCQRHNTAKQIYKYRQKNPVAFRLKDGNYVIQKDTTSLDYYDFYGDTLVAFYLQNLSTNKEYKAFRVELITNKSKLKKFQFMFPYTKIPKQALKNVKRSNFLSLLDYQNFNRKSTYQL